MKIQSIGDKAFSTYGKVIEGLDTSELLKAMEGTPAPGEVVYVPSDPELEKLPIFKQLQDSVYGGMPIQLGYCNGENHKLNALEYHRDSEVNLACTDLILLIGRQQDIDLKDFSYDTSLVEAFLVPAGSLIEVYATTLHYAPVSTGGRFRCCVILPRGTNEPLKTAPQGRGEDKLLTHVNKWLIAHPEAGIEGHQGLKGENITL